MSDYRSAGEKIARYSFGIELNHESTKERKHEKEKNKN